MYVLSLKAVAGYNKNFAAIFHSAVKILIAFVLAVLFG